MTTTPADLQRIAAEHPRLARNWPHLDLDPVGLAPEVEAVRQRLRADRRRPCRASSVRGDGRLTAVLVAALLEGRQLSGYGYDPRIL